MVVRARQLTNTNPTKEPHPHTPPTSALQHPIKPRWIDAWYLSLPLYLVSSCSKLTTALRQLSREDEAQTDTVVTREDQNNINKFSTLHQKQGILKEELEKKNVNSFPACAIRFVSLCLMGVVVYSKRKNTSTT